MSREEDIRGFQIAVDDTFCMERLEGRQDVEADLQRF